MKPKQVNLQINRLTKNEDEAQDFWVHYLSGKSIESFISHLQKVSNEYSEHEHVKLAIWQVIKNPPGDKFYKMLDNFSDFERSVLCLLTLGLTIREISGYKGISEVRLHQVIASIKKSACWKELYGIENEVDGGGEIRS